MKTLCYRLFLTAAACLGGCAYVHHVPPGQSAAFALAPKPEIVALPPAPPKPISVALPEPELPNTEKVEDDFALGNFCFEQGRYPEAIQAYQHALKLNPNFSEAWNKLAIAYQNSGDEKKAVDAFKRSKMASTP